MFSGKCDFYDGFVAISSNDNEEKLLENLKKLNLYVYGKDGRGHRVKSDTIKDIAKYYPYLKCIMCYDKDSGYKIYLASDSFIDKEEKEHLNWYIEDVLKYWRKCKRKKKPFVAEECVEELKWMKEDLIQVIAERVAKDGDKAEFEDIHLPMHEYYRKLWYEEMVKVGYTEFEAFCWVYKEMFPTAEDMEKRLNTKW